MQTATKNNTAKIISGILATISIVVIARIVFPAIWFWIGFEVSAALLVAIGYAGEWYLHHHPAGRKKVEKEEHHKLESRFIAAVVIGVFMEFLALGHAIPEAVRLEKNVASANERASTNELQVLELKTNLAELNKATLELAHQYDLSTNALVEAYARLAEASNTVASAKQFADAAQNASQSAQATALQASNTVDNANLAVLQHLNRHLSNDEKVKLYSAISSLPKGTISFNLERTVTDADDLANDIYPAFQAAGWKLGRVGAVLMLSMGQGVQVRGNESDGTSIAKIADALTSIGQMGFAITNSANSADSASNGITITPMMKVRK